MSPFSSLEGIALESVNSDSRGQWVPFPSGHSLEGSDWYAADPYWWDGTLPNGVRVLLNNFVTQASTATALPVADKTVELVFWQDIGCTVGAFVEFSMHIANLMTVNGGLDGRARLKAGTIASGAKAIAIERYVDSNPPYDTSLPYDTFLSLFFAVVKTASGYHAAIQGPRWYSSFSFPCPAFAARPVRLTRKLTPSTAAISAYPCSIRHDLGEFAVPLNDGDFMHELTPYASRFAKSTSGHRPDQSAIQVIAPAQTNTQFVDQRRLTEIISCGAYASTGNKFIPWARPGTNPSSLSMRVTITGAATWTNLPSDNSFTNLAFAMRNALPRINAAIQSLNGVAAESNVSTLANGARGLGTKFESPVLTISPPEVPYGVQTPQKPTVGNLRESYPVWSEYPDYADTWDPFKAIWSEEAYAGLVAYNQSQLNNLLNQIALWNDPETHFTAAIPWFTSRPNNVINSDSFSTTAGDTATVRCDITPYLRGPFNRFDSRQKTFDANTSESQRQSGSVLQLQSFVQLWTDTGTTQIRAQFYGTRTEKYKTRDWAQKIQASTYMSSVFGGLLRLKSGQSLFEWTLAKTVSPEEFFLARTRNYTVTSADDEYTLTLQPLTRSQIQTLFNTATVTISQAVDIYVESGLSSLGQPIGFIGTVPAEIVLSVA